MSPFSFSTNFQPNIIGPDYYGRWVFTTRKKNDYIISEEKNKRPVIREKAPGAGRTDRLPF
ncbi:hypothetical protein CS542_01220 [Pedobacter sp. IW39]|nr:hypothetical protein CS542_01220 [Pedobacter sp. IW39]